MHVNLLFKKIAALIPCLLLTVALNAQTVTKAFRSVPLKTVLEEVERQTGYSILFENEDVDVSRPVTATFKDATLQTVLDTVLDGTRDEVTLVWVEAWALGRRNDPLATEVRAQMDQLGGTRLLDRL